MVGFASAKDPNEVRKTEVLRDGAWVQVPLREIKAGDRFRMFEPEGDPVKGNQGETEWLAVKDAVKHGPSYGVIADPIKGETG